MSNTANNTKSNGDEEWLKSLFEKAKSYLIQSKVGSFRLLQKESVVLPPLLALWKIELKDGKKLWVLTGNMPSDHTDAKPLSHPRDAIHHFSLSWQLKAENLLVQLENEKVLLGDKKIQSDYAESLIANAEKLYQLASSDKYWR